MNTRALIVGTGGAAAFALVAAHADAGWFAVARLALCGGALAIAAAADLAEHRVPNRVVLPAAAACAVLTLAGGSGLCALVWGLALVAFLLVVSLAWPAALGMGDVKLALLIAVGLNGNAPKGLVLGIVFAALAGFVLLALRGRQSWGRAIPLAPFLAAGSLAALLL